MHCDTNRLSATSEYDSILDASGWVVYNTRSLEMAVRHTRRGVEQWQLVRLITWRSLVRVQPPQLFSRRPNMGVFGLNMRSILLMKLLIKILFSYIYNI
jgi:hypothetical protein